MLSSVWLTFNTSIINKIYWMDKMVKCRINGPVAAWLMWQNQQQQLNYPAPERRREKLWFCLYFFYSRWSLIVRSAAQCSPAWNACHYKLRKKRPIAIDTCVLLRERATITGHLKRLHRLACVKCSASSRWWMGFFAEAIFKLRKRWICKRCKQHVFVCDKYANGAHDLFR